MFLGDIHLVLHEILSHMTYWEGVKSDKGQRLTRLTLLLSVVKNGFVNFFIITTFQSSLIALGMI